MPRPHDLLPLGDETCLLVPDSLASDGPDPAPTALASSTLPASTLPASTLPASTLPPWVPAALARAPWVVVRRASPLGRLIPVGVRGASRSERFAAYLAPARFPVALSPEDLAHPALRERHVRTRQRAHLPVFRALADAAAILDGTGLPWGPTGSVGFELASGWPAATERSDLDLLVRPRGRLSGVEARDLLAQLERAAADFGLRVDVQVETPHGAVLLPELARPAAQVLLRTPWGPRLVDDPWAAGPEDTSVPGESIGLQTTEPSARGLAGDRAQGLTA